MDYDPLDADSDAFRPPAIPTLVGCLHCGETYESYRIEWRILPNAAGGPHGFWCCPIDGCSGMGFGFDILPVDPDYRDENGGWMHFDDEDEDEEAFDEAEAESDASEPGVNGEAHGSSGKDEDDDEPLPW